MVEALSLGLYHSLYSDYINVHDPSMEIVSWAINVRCKINILCITISRFFSSFQVSARLVIRNLVSSTSFSSWVVTYCQEVPEYISSVPEYIFKYWKMGTSECIERVLASSFWDANSPIWLLHVGPWKSPCNQSTRKTFALICIVKHLFRSEAPLAAQASWAHKNISAASHNPGPGTYPGHSVSLVKSQRENLIFGDSSHHRNCLRKQEMEPLHCSHAHLSLAWKSKTLCETHPASSLTVFPSSWLKQIQEGKGHLPLLYGDCSFKP